jgi:hypothetical protein
MLGIKQRVSTLPSLPAIKGRFSGADRCPNASLSGGMHSELPLAACVIQGPLINFQMPVMVANEFKLQRAQGVFDIFLVALVYTRKIDEVSTTIATCSSSHVLFAPSLSLTETMQARIAIGGCALDAKWFSDWSSHLHL